MTVGSETDNDAIKPQGWMIADPGSPVIAADGEEIGTVRERTPHFIQVRTQRDLLTDVEMYVPGELIAAVEAGRVHLSRTRDQLDQMELTTSPALRG